MAGSRRTPWLLIVCLIGSFTLAGALPEELKFESSEPAKILGQVLYSDGTPFAESVELSPNDTSLSLWDRAVLREYGEIDAEGRFELTDLEAGTYDLGVPGTGLEGLSLGLELVPGETRDLGTTYLPLYVEKGGSVRSSEGPLGRASVRATVDFADLDPRPTIKGRTHVGQVFEKWYGDHLEADEDGRFVARIPAGFSFRLTAGSAGFEPRVIELDPPTGLPNPIEIVLGAGGGIKVLALGVDGQPVFGASVLLMHIKKGGAYHEKGFTSSNAEGRAGFVNLMPGVYMVFCGTEPAQGRFVELERGRDAEVELKDCESDPWGE